MKFFAETRKISQQQTKLKHGKFNENQSKSFKKCLVTLKSYKNFLLFNYGNKIDSTLEQHNRLTHARLNFSQSEKSSLSPGGPSETCRQSMQNACMHAANIFFEKSMENSDRLHGKNLQNLLALCKILAKFACNMENFGKIFHFLRIQFGVYRVQRYIYFL